MREAFKEYLKTLEVEFNESFKLSGFSYVKIGGEAFTVFPNTEDKLIKCIGYLFDRGIKYKVVGRMSNTLAPSAGYDGIVVATGGVRDWNIDGTVLTLGAGSRLFSIVPHLLSAGLSGFEELLGIPGSVGGLVYENAGAFARTVSDILVDARVYDTVNGRVFVLTNDEMKLGYRRSILSENRNLVLLSARVRLEKRGTQESIKKRITELAEKRRATQPLEYPSLGSVFKRPKVGFAGAYIEMAGLKGYTVGGAMISPKHAGFIVNIGGCSSDDFIAVMNAAESAVYEQFGVKLEREVEILE